MIPKIVVLGVGGAGGNAVNNMMESKLPGVEFIAANTDAQSLAQSLTKLRIQLGAVATKGLGAGSRPDIGRAAAEESLEEIIGQIGGANMVFITAGMGGGTGSGAAPVIARAAREQGILTVGVVTKPFHFEGAHRMRTAEAAIEELSQYVDTLIIIPNQNLFRVATERTTFADAFKMADDVLYSGVRGVTDLMIMPGLINLDFADIRTIMSEMGKAMMGTGEACGEKRAIAAAEAAISNPLLDDTSMKGAKGVLINITGGMDMTLFEVDEAANRIRDEVGPDANIIFGSTFDETLNGKMRVSVVATGIASEAVERPKPTVISLVGQQLPSPAQARVDAPAPPSTFRATVVASQGAPEFSAVAAVAAKPVQVEPDLLEGAPDIVMPEPRMERSEPALRPGLRMEPCEAPDMSTLTRAVSDFAETASRQPAAQPKVRQPEPPPEPPRRMGGLFDRLRRWSRARQAEQHPATPTAAQPSQPHQGGMAARSEPNISCASGDLDIPAFLRRHADADIPCTATAPVIGAAAEDGSPINSENFCQRESSVRWRREGYLAADADTGHDENTGRDTVNCSVFSPPDIPLGRQALVQVFLHLPQDTRVAASEARNVDEDTTRRVVKGLSAPIVRGWPVRVALLSKELVIHGSPEEIVWNGEVAHAAFIVEASKTCPLGSVPMTVQLSIGSLPVGHIRFTIKVCRVPEQSGDARPVGEEVRYYRRAFISYASVDQPEVVKRVQMLATLGISFFQDVMHLRQGSLWKDRIFSEIEESDVFLLFWSSSARSSEFVAKEIAAALRCQAANDENLPSIVPVPIEGPPPVPPPAELAHLQFNDPCLYFMAKEAPALA